VAEISADFILKTIIGHFLSDRDAYMTTQFPDINCCIPDIVMVSESGSSPCRGNFRLKERTYEHQAQPMSGAKPVTVGQGYSTIAVIPETEGSWALSLLHERITNLKTPLRKPQHN
jgi:hypothetical protein